MKVFRALLEKLNFEKFSIHVKRALKTAEVAATRAGSDCVDTQHLLLGMLAEDDGTAVKILRRLSCDVESVRNQLRGGVSAAAAPEQRRYLLRSAAVKRAIEYAVEQARTTRAPSTGTEHLLLAFLQQPDCRACQVLTAAGVTRDQIRAAVDAENVQR
jgi:ATP-dependent Clp protease ATP-binding subunit ClpC